MRLHGSLLQSAAVPISFLPTRGFLQVGDARCPVRWEPDSTHRKPWKQQRFVFYDYEGSPAAKKLLQDRKRQESLAQQLDTCIAGLQDSTVLLEQLLRGGNPEELSPAPSEQQKLEGNWRGIVEVQSVPPGHRAFNTATAAVAESQQMQAVYAKQRFAAGQLVGMYLGYVYDVAEVDKRQMFKTAQDEAYFLYQCDFTAKPPKGAKAYGSIGSSDTGISSAPRQFIIDATCCLEDNPLPHMLDYRAFQRDGAGKLRHPLAEDVGRSFAGGANCMLLPLSDNESGKVYCAVMALRVIQAGQELCTDYGAAYWQVISDLEQYRQWGRQEAASERTEELKELKQQLAQQATVTSTLRDGLQAVLGKVDAALVGFAVALQQLPPMGKVAVAQLGVNIGQIALVAQQALDGAPMAVKPSAETVVPAAEMPVGVHATPEVEPASAAEASQAPPAAEHSPPEAAAPHVAPATEPVQADAVHSQPTPRAEAPAQHSALAEDTSEMQQSAEPALQSTPTADAMDEDPAAANAAEPSYESTLVWRRRMPRKSSMAQVFDSPPAMAYATEEACATEAQMPAEAEAEVATPRPATRGEAVAAASEAAPATPSSLTGMRTPALLQAAFPNAVDGGAAAAAAAGSNGAGAGQRRRAASEVINSRGAKRANLSSDESVWQQGLQAWLRSSNGAAAGALRPADLACLDGVECLNAAVVDTAIKLLEAQVPQQVRTRFLFLDSSFFPALAGSDNLGLVYDNLRKGRAAARTAYNRVKHFIEGVGAFDKDYWLLPLHKSCGGKVHWGLAIICHTGRIGQRLEQLSNQQQQQQQQQRVSTGPGQPCIIYLESYGSDFFWWPAIEKALTYFMEQAWLAEHSRQQQAANAVAAAAAAAAAAGDHGLLAREVPQVPKEVPIPFHDQTGRPSEVLPFYSLNNLPSLNSINNTGLFMLTYLERFVDAAPAGLTMADVQAADRDEELAGPLSGRQPRLLCCDWFQPALALGLRAELRQVLQQMLQPQPQQQQQQQQQLAEQQQPAPIESTFQEDSAEAEVIEIEDDSE